jgi:tetratricopeptide (TPR) repeat protein
VAMPEVAVPEVAVPEAAVPETEVPVVTVPEVAVPEAAMPEEVAAEQPVTLPASLAEPEPEPEMARQAVPTKPASMPAPAAAVDLPVTEAAAPVEPYMAVPSRAKPAADNAYQLLAAAREAYWLRDYETAESKYRELLALQPDNPDGYGELGNMYFSQGMWEQSASAYFDAGTRLVKEGQLEQARQLVDVIRGLDGTQADELNTLINEYQATTH